MEGLGPASRWDPPPQPPPPSPSPSPFASPCPCPSLSPSSVPPWFLGGNREETRGTRGHQHGPLTAKDTRHSQSPNTPNIAHLRIFTEPYTKHVTMAFADHEPIFRPSGEKGCRLAPPPPLGIGCPSVCWGGPFQRSSCIDAITDSWYTLRRRGKRGGDDEGEKGGMNTTKANKNEDGTHD